MNSAPKIESDDLSTSSSTRTFTPFPTTQTTWNSKTIGHRQTTLAELAELAELARQI